MKQVSIFSKNITFKDAQLQQMQENPQMLYEQTMPDVQIPDIYKRSSEVYNKEDIKEKVKKFDMMSLVHPWLEHPFLMLGTAFGLSWGVDKFSQACSGEYEKSLVGKAANFGDKIQNSGFVKSSPMQSVIKTCTKIKNKIADVFKNSDLINAFRKTPSQPEWTMVKDELLNMQQRVVHDFSRVTSTLKLNSDEVVKLSNLGMTKEEGKFIKTFFEGLEKNEENIVNALQLKRLGLEDDAIKGIVGFPNASKVVKEKNTRKKLGLTTDFLQKLEKNAASPDDIIKIREACKKAKNVKIGVGKIDLLGPFQPIARTIGLDEVGNRLVSMGDHVKHTKLGRAFASFLQKCHRGFTFGGGKGGVLLFITPLIVEAMMNVKRAEPKEKVATAVHDGTHAVSWVFTFPLAVKLMHKLGGMQYAGMSPEQVAEYRKLITEFNSKVKSGTFNTYKEYLNGINGIGGRRELETKLKALKNVKNQNLLTKICKKLASFMTMDLETIKPFQGKNPLVNLGRKMPNFLKNVAGVPIRFIIWGVLSMGLFDTIINKTIKLFFGEYHDGLKEQEHRDAKKAQKKFLKEDLQKRLVEAQQEKVMGQIPTEGNLQNENITEYINPQESMQLINNEQANLFENNAKKEEIFKDLANNNNIEKTETPLETTPENTNSNIETKKETEEIKAKTEEELVEEKTSTFENNEIMNISPKENEKNNTDRYSFIPSETSVIQTQQEEIKEPVDNYTFIPNQNNQINQNITNPIKQDSYSYIPSSENTIKPEKKDDVVNKYIPSQDGAKITMNFDNSALDAALRRADRAEQRALQTLAGNFEGL